MKPSGIGVESVTCWPETQASKILTDIIGSGLEILIVSDLNNRNIKISVLNLMKTGTIGIIIMHFIGIIYNFSEKNKKYLLTYFPIFLIIILSIFSSKTPCVEG